MQGRKTGEEILSGERAGGCRISGTCIRPETWTPELPDPTVTTWQSEHKQDSEAKDVSLPASLNLNQYNIQPGKNLQDESLSPPLPPSPLASRFPCRGFPRLAVSGAETECTLVAGAAAAAEVGLDQGGLLL